MYFMKYTVFGISVLFALDCKIPLTVYRYYTPPEIILQERFSDQERIGIKSDIFAAKRYIFS